MLDYMDIQSLIDYKTTDVENVMEVRTDFIDPSDQSSNLRRFRFKLDPIGFLSDNTILTFKIVDESGENNNPRLNCINGGLGGLERATITIGDRVLQDFNGVNDYSTAHNLYKLDRDHLNGYYTHLLQNQFVSEADKNVKQIVYSNDDGGYDMTGPEPNSFKIYEKSDDSWEVAIPLDIVFPSLKSQEIPLFLFDPYNIFLTFYFSTPDKYIIDSSNPARRPSANENYVIVEPTLRVDYKLYPITFENKLRDRTIKEGGYVMDFLDVLKVENIIAASTLGNKLQKEFRLQLQNKEVHHITCIKKYQDGVDAGADKNGNSRTVFPTGRDQYCIGLTDESYNIRVNGTDLYEEDLRFPNQHYNQVEYTLDKRLEIERPFYYSDRNTRKSGLTENQFTGLYKPMCADIRNGNMRKTIDGRIVPAILGGGTQIANYPIVWKFKSTTINTYDEPAKEVNFYVAVTRKAIITNNGIKQNVMITY